MLLNKNKPVISIKRSALLISLLLSFMIFKTVDAAQAGKIRISVTVAPQAYFAERIGGNRVDVQIMLPGHANHDSYEPTPQQMVRLSRTQLYIKVGVPEFAIETKAY